MTRTKANPFNVLSVRDLSALLALPQDFAAGETLPAFAGGNFFPVVETVTALPPDMHEVLSSKKMCGK